MKNIFKFLFVPRYCIMTRGVHGMHGDMFYVNGRKKLKEVLKNLQNDPYTNVTSIIRVWELPVFNSTIDKATWYADDTTEKRGLYHYPKRNNPLEAKLQPDYGIPPRDFREEFHENEANKYHDDLIKGVESGDDKEFNDEESKKYIDVVQKYTRIAKDIENESNQS